jgi:hypothetical protein
LSPLYAVAWALPPSRPCPWNGMITSYMPVSSRVMVTVVTFVSVRLIWYAVDGV